MQVVLQHGAGFAALVAHIAVEEVVLAIVTTAVGHVFQVASWVPRARVSWSWYSARVRPITWATSPSVAERPSFCCAADAVFDLALLAPRAAAEPVAAAQLIEHGAADAMCTV
jgi:hypothetical protein